MRQLRTMLLGVLVLAGLPGQSPAEDFPSRPIRIVVAYAAGGPTDIMARLLADKLGDKLGQRVVVENRGGGGGSIGYEAVSKSPPDGYTVGFVETSLTVNPSLYKPAKFDAEKDFTPISLTARGPHAVIVPATIPAKSLAEFITWVKGKGGNSTYGSAGSGTPPHLNAEFFKAAQGLAMVHVPYKGTGPGVIDLVAGRIDVMFLNIGSVKPQIEDGTLRALAVSGGARAQTLPDVPTYREAGFPMPELDPGTWWGVVGPPGLPADVTAKLNGALQAALSDPELREKLAKMNVEPTPSSTSDFASLIARETKKWADVINRAKITAD